MKHLRTSILGLILALTVFFNIERLDFGIENFIDIHSFTYVLVFISVVSIILIPKLRQLPLYNTYLAWTAVYLLLRFMVFNQRPIIGGIHTYIFVTEVALLTVSIWFAHHLAEQIYDFEEAVANITFTETDRRVQPLNVALEDIKIELTRSRRYKSPLSVLVVTPETNSIQVALHRTIMEVQRAMMNRYVLTSMSRVISMALRRTDMVMEQHEKERFVILSPHTPGSDLQIVVKRIQDAISKQLGVNVKCGVASFPEDALTFDELLHKAEQNLDQPSDDDFLDLFDNEKIENLEEEDERVDSSKRMHTTT